MAYSEDLSLPLSILPTPSELFDYPLVLAFTSSLLRNTSFLHLAVFTKASLLS